MNQLDITLAGWNPHKKNVNFSQAPIGLGPTYEVPGKMTSIVSNSPKVLQSGMDGSKMVCSASYSAAYTSTAIVKSGKAEPNRSRENGQLGHQLLESAKMQR